MTTTVGLLLTVEAKPGREDEVEKLFAGALPIVQGEPETIAWFAIRLGPSTFGIFDAFPGDEGRQAHLTGEVPKALDENAELFAGPADIRMVDVLANKLP
jgi:quinol monooxygenase YgiN